mmetsp:Transcript_36708/g.76439  ORF Transcript_36708/g.76439 Transcript_36708/m.76439 type:complete len:89 (+) Transcript_36708:511-777(+)
MTRGMDDGTVTSVHTCLLHMLVGGPFMDTLMESLGAPCYYCFVLLRLNIQICISQPFLLFSCSCFVLIHTFFICRPPILSFLLALHML